MEIREHISLADFTTFRLGGPARFFAQVVSVEELVEALRFAKEKKLRTFVLGGGSNILVSDTGFDGLVIKMNLRGREVYEDEESVLLDVAAGEVLDDVVAWSVERGWWGIENLSFVPGLVGALVIQNVNAYGVKAEHVVESVEAYDMQAGEMRTFSNEACQFRYRGSIFNKEEKDRYVVLSVKIRLMKTAIPKLQYADLKKYFIGKSITDPTLSQIREAIVHIRKGKGFDPEKYWSAGSFFSNLMLDRDAAQTLRDRILSVAGERIAQKYDLILEKFYEEGEKDPNLEVGKVKIPTGFILDQVLNLKGYRHGGAHVSSMHAQTFINDGTATASDIYELYLYIKNLAKDKLGLELVHEPEFVGL